ncbi:MAG: DUF5695 domain-containing protein, partial [Bacteroidales bacterium]
NSMCRYCVLLIAFLLLQINAGAQKTVKLSDGNMNAVFSQTGISSVTCSDDPYKASPLSGRFGRPVINYRIARGDWLTHYMGNTIMNTEDDKVNYLHYIKGMPMSLEQEFIAEDGGINWKMKLKTEMEFPVKIGDFAIPLPWNLPRGGNPEQTFETGFTKHHYIAGDGSFIYFTRPSGKAPYFIIMALPGTRLEYFDADGEYRVYIHSGHAGNIQEGNWRYEHTYHDLAPAGEEGSQLEYSFRMQWANSYDELRQILYDNGLLDIRVVPGMSLPRDLEARVAIRSKKDIRAIRAEYPEQTEIEFIEKTDDNHYIYKVRFDRLGENMLFVDYGDGLTNHLEFFSTEDLETLFKKRASFIVNSQQHKVPGKWWDGLYSVYDMKNGVLRGPENTDGYDHWWGYVLASDDPALCKAPYVAAKNVFYPDDDEIKSVEYYLENFVWGGLQRTAEETPYPYGIYGTPNWMVNRDPVKRAGVKDRNLDKMNIWRSYDYPHIIMLYYHMYQVAEMYPDKVEYLDAEGYLERAWQTARAYFIYPYEILPWYDTYKWGCYNELVIEDLISVLEEHGRDEEAAWLRNEYEKKVKYFIYDDDYPYRSEYAIDRTAFESSYAFARYGATRDMEPDTNLWYDVKLEKWWSHPGVSKEEARDFMDQQHYAGLAVRGWLETKYFLLGSDFTTSSDRHCLSYMARMGGWSVLDYGLRFAEKPWDWLQLGYASYLSAWSLMNTGTEESNYGYWAPGKENDGATGWAFMASKKGRAWIRKDVERGAWFYDGEQDLGHGSAVRMAATVLAEDPLFGWLAYGGKLEEKGMEYHVTPKDGLRCRFWVMTEDERVGMEMERDGFKKDEKVIYDSKGKTIKALVENRSGDEHITRVYLSLPPDWELKLDGKKLQIRESGSRKYAEMKISSDTHLLTLEKK